MDTLENPNIFISGFGVLFNHIRIVIIESCVEETVFRVNLRTSSSNKKALSWLKFPSWIKPRAWIKSFANLNKVLTWGVKSFKFPMSKTMLHQFCQFGHQIKVIVGKNVSTMIVFKDRVVALWVAWFSQEEVTFTRLFIIDMRKVIVVLQERTLRMVNDTSPINNTSAGISKISGILKSSADGISRAKTASDAPAFWPQKLIWRLLVTMVEAS